MPSLALLVNREIIISSICEKGELNIDNKLQWYSQSYESDTVFLHVSKNQHLKEHSLMKSM